MKWISIAILTYNEEKNIEKCLHNIRSLEGIEDADIMVSDGGSSDQTIELIDESVILVVSKPNKSIQMNEAIATTHSPVIWFVHADMTLPLNALTLIKESIDSGYDGGGFANVFDQYNDKIKRLGNIMNFRFFNSKEQSDKGIFYGDNGIFVKREVLNFIGGVPKQEIMEDYELSMRLVNYGAKLKKIYKDPIVVSARRHVQDGFIRTRFKWILIRELYKLGVSTESLRKLYNDNR